MYLHIGNVNTVELIMSLRQQSTGCVQIIFSRFRQKWHYLLSLLADTTFAQVLSPYYYTSILSNFQFGTLLQDHRKPL